MADHQSATAGQTTASAAAVAGMSTCGSLQSEDDDELVPPLATVDQKLAEIRQPGTGSPPASLPTSQSAPVPLEREKSMVITPFMPLPVSQLSPRGVLHPELQKVVDAAIAMASRHLPADGSVPKDSYVAVVLTPMVPSSDVCRIPSLAQGPQPEHKPTHPEAEETGTAKHTASSWVSWHAALSSVAERISQFASHFDWFQHKMKETGMVSPCGTSTTTLTSVINLISGTLDAALLSTPLIMSYCGWLLSLFLFIMLALLGVFTTRILVTVCIAEHTESYHMTIFRTLGRHVMNGYQVLLIAGTLGSLMAYLMLVGDFAQAALLFITHVPINRRHAIIGFTLVFVLPLSLLRKLKSLWFTGFLSIGFMSFFAVALFVKLGQYGVTSSSGRGDGHVFAVHATAESVFQALPLTAFSLTNHANVIPVFHEMRCRTVAAFTTVSAWTYGIIGTMFFLTALCGYLLFGGAQSGNVLHHFEYLDDELMAVVALCMLFLMVFTYPVMQFPMRISIHYFLYGETDTTRLQHVLETAAPLAIALIGALYLTDVGVVFTLIGALTTSSSFFLLPAIMYLKTKTITLRPLYVVVLCYFSIVLGAVVLCCGFVATLTSHS